MKLTFAMAAGVFFLARSASAAGSWLQCPPSLQKPCSTACSCSHGPEPDCRPGAALACHTDCQCRGKSPPPSYPSHEGGGKPGPKPKPHPDPKRTPVAESYQPGTEGQKGKTSRRKPHKRDLAALADLVEEGEELALL